MILDTLENSRLYETINPRFKKAFEFLKSNDLQTLPLGKIELEGTNLVVSVVEITGKTAEQAKMETHSRHIDIQIPLNKNETMGWIAGNKLTQTTGPYNPEKDVTFFADKASNFITVQPFEFAIFFPGDGHQPGMAEGTIHKIIVKILI